MEAEVIAHHNQHIGLRKVEFGLVRQPSIQGSTALRCVIRIEVSVSNEWLVIRQSIKVEAVWRTVVMEKLVGKNLRALSDRVPTWSPDPLHGLVCKAHVFFLVILPGKEESIKAHLCEEASVCVRMSEGINLPTDSGSDTELLHNKFMTNLHVIDHVIVMGAGLIVHRPTCIQELETAFSNETTDLLLKLFGLVSPPHREEFHLNVREAFLGVSE